MAQARTASGLDALGISLSSLCVVHCLVLPVLVVSLPVLGPFVESELLHRTMVVLASVTVLAVWISSRDKPYWPFFVLAGLGLGLLWLGAFAHGLFPHEHGHGHELDHHGDEASILNAEVILTVIGAVVMACAHGLRWWNVSPSGRERLGA